MHAKSPLPRAVYVNDVRLYTLELRFTALFNNTRTLNKSSTDKCSLPSIKCSAGPPSLRLLPNSVRCLNSAQRFDHRALGSSRKLGGSGEHLIDGREKRICRLSFEF